MSLPTLSSLIDETRDSRSSGFLNFKENRQHYLADVYLAWREGNAPGNKTEHNRRIDILLTRQGVSMRNPKSENLCRRLGFRRIIKATIGNELKPMQSIMCHALEVIHSQFEGRRVSHNTLMTFIVDQGGVTGLYTLSP